MPSLPATFLRFDFCPRGAPLECWWLPAPRELLVAATAAEVPACLARAEAARQAGQVVAGFVAYEAAPACDAALRTHPPAAGWPVLWLAIADAAAPAPPLPAPGGYALGAWQPGMDADRYAAAFARIRQHLIAGDTYQVNLTFPLAASFAGDPGGLYAALRGAQPTAYCAWLHTPEWDVLSASPELFFAVTGDRIVTRPMKGTRRRGLTRADDLALAADLARQPKERAENVMIVDLLRNDLGRIARLGSVVPERLFEVEQYPTVWQMTSTVAATLAPGVGLPELYRGLFPCGSVTGAPKVKTMEVIAREELGPRGVYCGALGFATRDRMVFNVAIRTLTLRAGLATYHVGSGVTIGADCAPEYDECLAKAQVLHAAATRPAFELLETLLLDPARGPLLLERHLDRLAASAAYFDFPCDRAALRARLLTAAAAASAPQRARLLLARDGTVRLELSAPPPPADRPWRLRLAPHPIAPGDPFLYHKTTHRQLYTAAAASRGEADDVLLWNPAGELTEATIANLAVQLDGRWLTPPVACGLLPGTQRAELLASGAWQEGIVTRADLARATGLQLANALRGVWPAALPVAGA